MTTTEPADIGAQIRRLVGDSLSYLYPAALRAAVVLELPDHLATGATTVEALAERTGGEPDRLLRLLRFLAGRGLFTEQDGAFATTPLGDLLRAGSRPSVRDVVLLFTDDLYWTPAQRLPRTVRDGRTAFDAVHGRPFFDHLAEDGAGAAVFDAGIATMSSFEQAAVAAAYGFAPDAVVADLGGGHGGLLAAVLTRHPGASGLLVDRDHVAARFLDADRALDGRWRRVAADFRREVPEGADVYLLKRILHDKDDAECSEILSSCRRAMHAGARLLVVDAVVSRAGGDTPGDQLSDLLMMTVWDGRERTEDDFRGLLEKAGLRLTRVLPTPTSLSIVEAAVADPA